MATWRLVTETPTEELGPLPPHAHRPRRRGLRFLERLLLIIGVVCLGYYAYVWTESALYQAYEARELDEILASAPPPEHVQRPFTTVTVAPPAPRPQPPAGALIGRLEIPSLRVSAIVRAGSDSRTLRLAVGHIGGTALPGERGNIGLAAHRDTFFRRLGEIRENDLVRLVTPEGTFTYRVSGTQIVEPRETWVLDPTSAPALTLITCYPFRYIGSAPQRFVVRAALAAG